MTSEPSHDEGKRIYGRYTSGIHQDEYWESPRSPTYNPAMKLYYVLGGILIPLLATFVLGGFGLIASATVSIGVLLVGAVKGVGPNPYTNITPNGMIACKVALITCILIVVGVTVIVL